MALTTQPHTDTALCRASRGYVLVTEIHELVSLEPEMVRCLMRCHAPPSNRRRRADTARTAGAPLLLLPTATTRGAVWTLRGGYLDPDREREYDWVSLVNSA